MHSFSNDYCEHEICSRFCRICQLAVLKPYIGKDLCQYIKENMDEVIEFKCVSYEHDTDILRLTKEKNKSSPPVISSYHIHIQGDNDSINGFFTGIWDFCEASVFPFKRLRDINLYELNKEYYSKTDIEEKSKGKEEVLTFNDDGYETSYFVNNPEKFCGGFQQARMLFKPEGFFLFLNFDTI
jgi:hypothetical protein